MPSFRCYGLDRNGRIVAAQDVEADDADGAVNLGKRFVASEALHQAGEHGDLGLEIWQGGNLVFTTLRDRPAQRPPA